jgi:hypothetical protein
MENNFLNSAYLLQSVVVHLFIRTTSTNEMQSRTSLERPRGFQEFEAPKFQDSRHMRVLRLSAVRTGLLPPHPLKEISLVLISVRSGVDSGPYGYVNEKFQLQHRESNSQPSGL